MFLFMFACILDDDGQHNTPEGSALFVCTLNKEISIMSKEK